MSVFEHESKLACSVEGLFDFLTKPENITQVSHPDLGLKFVSPPPILSAGVELEFQLVSFGQVHTLKHQITHFERPLLVIENQLQGPMKSWTHHHVYESDGPHCIKIDRIEFAPPGGMIGFFLTEDKIIDQLEDGMFIREQRLKEMIERGLIV